MATYNLNEELKEREKRKKLEKQGANAGAEEVLALDDVSRVKVLSPGRKVFKRFIRNRLAVFGSVTLIVLFVFSYFGPLVYPYGQKQIFYKYDTQNVNYALARVNTAYNGYDTGAGKEAERSVLNAVNSNIKKMGEQGAQEMFLPGEEGNGYLLREETDHVYTLSAVPMEKIATSGLSSQKIGTYSMIGKQFEFAGEEVPGLAEAAAGNIKGASGSFTVDGVEYTFSKGAKPKTFDVYSERDGLAYTGDPEGAEFEKALETALNSEEDSFALKDTVYALIRQKDSTDIYRIGTPERIRVYTLYTMDLVDPGQPADDSFKAAALLSLADEEPEFTWEGKNFALEPEEGIWIILDESGEPYAEFSSLSVRRYSGEDTMSYELKNIVSSKIEEMIGAGEKTGTVTAQIPMQNEDGSYAENEDGSYIQTDTEMRISQRLEGEYVINCDQINFVIDIFAPPSVKHILGTDGDGFDVLARVMYGGRVSLMVGFIVVFIETFLGVIMGGLAGYFGGWVDNLIMRLVDIFYCLPYLPIMIILGAMMDSLRLDTYIRLCVMMAALGLMGWAGVARLVRGQILSLREQEFMVATEATGIRVKDRIFRHLIPNVMPQLIVMATMSLGGVIITESTLSFLGLGVKHPLATWGTIINSVSSASAMAHYAFIWIPVGLLICFTVIAFNFVGDGLRDAYDPKSKR